MQSGGRTRLPSNGGSRSSVSVVIPCRDREDVVADAVNSALGQTEPVREIVCVDDGSSDGTLRVLKTLAEEHPERVRVLRTPGRGAGAARNLGLAEVSGTYVQFLDSDDVLLPRKVEHQLRVAGDRADLITGAFCRIDEAGDALDRFPEPGDAWRGLIFGNLGVTSSSLWRRTAVLEAGGWGERQASSQEYELMFRLLQRGGEVIPCQASETFKRQRSDAISKWGFPERVAYTELRIPIFEHLDEVGRFRGSLRTDGLRELLQLIRMLASADRATADRLFERVQHGVGWQGVPLSRSKWLTMARLLGVPRTERLRGAASALTG